MFAVLTFLCGLLHPVYAQERCVSEKCHGDRANFKHKHAVVDSCETCHSLTDEKKHKFAFTMEGKALCYMCHDNLEEGKSNNHIMKSGDSCTMCHNPHGADNPKLLTASKQSDLCGMCHGMEYADNKYKHGPLQDNDCTSCHNPHASENPKFLDMVGNDLCSMCHGDMKEEFKKAGSFHFPARLNCKTCHDPHGSKYKKYVKLPGSNLCVSCHRKARAQKGKFVIEKIEPKKENRCLNCHHPHFAPNKKLTLKPMKGPCEILK